MQHGSVPGRSTHLYIAAPLLPHPSDELVAKVNSRILVPGTALPRNVRDSITAHPHIVAEWDAACSLAFPRPRSGSSREILSSRTTALTMTSFCLNRPYDSSSSRSGGCRRRLEARPHGNLEERMRGLPRSRPRFTSHIDSLSRISFRQSRECSQLSTASR